MSHGAGNKQNAEVTQTGTTVVTAESALVHDHREPLCNLDFYVPKQDVDVIICYEKPHVGFESMVATLKKSLAQTLVDYYVFAGELFPKESSGELEILCNNRGVDFTEACVDLELSELDLHKPDDVIGGKLAPKNESGVFGVQVTEFLRCGSIVVACKFDHRVADAYATNMFLVSWSENALSKPLSFPPTRLIFNPRSSLRHGPEVAKFYSPISSLPPPFVREEPSSSSRVYYVTAEQTMALQAAASTETSKRTKLESFSAFLWQLLARSAFPERTESNVEKMREEMITKMAIIVDGRTRLTSSYDPQACKNYFGNVISAPYGSETVETVIDKPLSWLGERVGEIIKEGTSKDHFLDIMDLVEAPRPEITFPTIFWPRSSDGPKVIVSSGLRFPVGKLDFGWGRPRVGFYHLPWEFDSGYVMPVPHPAGNGDWVVYMYLPEWQIEFIEASHVFKPLTLDLLPR